MEGFKFEACMLNIWWLVLPLTEMTEINDVFHTQDAVWFTIAASVNRGNILYPHTDTHTAWCLILVVCLQSAEMSEDIISHRERRRHQQSSSLILLPPDFLFDVICTTDLLSLSRFVRVSFLFVSCCFLSLLTHGFQQASLPCNTFLIN